jgi:hypothetical protein
MSSTSRSATSPNLSPVQCGATRGHFRAVPRASPPRPPHRGASRRQVGETNFILALQDTIVGIKEGGKRRIAVRPERGWKSDKANCGAAIDVGTALGVPGASVTEVPRPPSRRLRGAWCLRAHVCAARSARPRGSRPLPGRRAHWVLRTKADDCMDIFKAPAPTTYQVHAFGELVGKEGGSECANVRVKMRERERDRSADSRPAGEAQAWAALRRESHRRGRGCQGLLATARGVGGRQPRVSKALSKARSGGGVLLRAARRARAMSARVL